MRRLRRQAIRRDVLCSLQSFVLDNYEELPHSPIASMHIMPRQAIYLHNFSVRRFAGCSFTAYLILPFSWHPCRSIFSPKPPLRTHLAARQVNDGLRAVC